MFCVGGQGMIFELKHNVLRRHPGMIFEVRTMFCYDAQDMIFEVSTISAKVPKT